MELTIQIFNETDMENQMCSSITQMEMCGNDAGRYAL